MKLKISKKGVALFVASAVISIIASAIEDAKTEDLIKKEVAEQLKTLSTSD